MRADEGFGAAERRFAGYLAARNYDHLRAADVDRRFRTRA